VNIEKGEDQIAMYERIIREKLSVRETERAVKARRDKLSATPKSTSAHKTSAFASAAAAELTERLEAKVAVQVSEKGKGKITIPFFTKEEFNRIKKLIISG